MKLNHIRSRVADRIALFLVAVMTATGCTEGPDQFAEPASGSRFSLQVSGQSATGQMLEGKKYRLYAVHKNGTSTGWESPYIDGVEATVTGGKLQYDGKTTFPAKGTLSFYLFGYGDSDTHGHTNAVPKIETAVEGLAGKRVIPNPFNPVGSLCDLLYAKVEDRNGSFAGVQMLHLSHSLAKLSFQVVATTTEENSEQSPVQVLGIAVEDYKKGYFNIAADQYEHTDSKEFQTIYGTMSTESVKSDNSNTTETLASTAERISSTDAETPTDPPAANQPTNQPVGEPIVAGTTPTTVLDPKDPTKALEWKVFPTDGTQSLRLQLNIRYSPTGPSTIREIEIKGPTYQDNSLVMKPFPFLAGHSYMLTLTLTNDQVNVIISALRQYEWQEETEEHQVTSPSIFNDLQWASRNLGADGSTPLENTNWASNTGFFYQFGRNIPYYIRANQYDTEKKEVYIRTEGPTPINALQPIPMLEAYVNHWKRSYHHPETGATNYAPSSSPNMTVKFTTPYSGIYEGAQDRSKRTYLLEDLNTTPPNPKLDKNDPYRYTYIEDDNTQMWCNDERAQTFWSDVKNQPVPPGWRIPTVDDWRAIYPTSKQAGDIACLSHSTYGGGARHLSYWGVWDSGTNSETEIDNKNIGSLLSRPWDATSPWRAWRDVISNDPESGSRTLYMCWRTQDKTTGEWQPWGTIYAIKNYQTERAYRMKWEIYKVGSDVVDTKVPIGRYALCITRFKTPNRIPPEQDDLTYETLKREINEGIWDDQWRVAGIALPLTGHIYQKGLINRGVEACYGTSTATKKNGQWNNTTVRIKFYPLPLNDKNIPTNADGCFLYIREDDTSGCRAFQLRLVRDTDFGGGSN